MSATSWGWKRDLNGLAPILTTEDPAPAGLLKLVSCKCEKGCTRSCGCRKAGLKCSEICFSCHGQTCTNVKTVEVEVETEDDVEEHSIQNAVFNGEIDQFGEPQDEYLRNGDMEEENDEEADIQNDEPLDESTSPGPSTRKRRRLRNHEEISDDEIDAHET